MDVIDCKHTFTAVNPVSGRKHTEADSFIVNAGDPAAPDGLRAYMQGCANYGAEPQHIKSVELLRERVEAYQEKMGGEREAGPEVIDRKYTIRAIHTVSKKELTESDAFLICAHDVAAPAMLLEMYIHHRDDAASTPERAEEIKQLLDRVLRYQAQVSHKVPDTAGAELIRCLDGEAVE